MTDTEIVIGSCAALDGASSFLGRETVIGAEAYCQLVNEEGGVHGRRLRLISADDSYDPAKTQACWDKLMAKEHKGFDHVILTVVRGGRRSRSPTGQLSRRTRRD